VAAGVGGDEVVLPVGGRAVTVMVVECLPVILPLVTVQCYVPR